MALFLSILKIIGIVLLVILGVVLLLLLLVLFVPVRYRIDAQIQETDLEKDKDKLKDNISGTAKFSWLLHFISGGISYPENTEFKVKVLCFTVFPPKNKKNDNEDTETEEDFEVEEISESDNKDEIVTEKESGFEETQDIEKESGIDEAQDIEKEREEKQEALEREETEDIEEEDDEFDDDKGFLSFLENIFDTIVKIIKVPQDVFAKIQYTTSRICDKINMVKNTLSNDIFKRAFEVTKKQLIRVIRMILPKKFSAEFLVGLDDPTVTADILAGYGMLYPILVNRVFIVPDFDRQVLKGELHVRGRITVFTLVHAAAILYFNKDVKKTVRRIQKIINS